MTQLATSDGNLFYEVRGKGAPVVLLHPFPAHHGFWHPAIAAGQLDHDYRLLLPDLRGHGQSVPGGAREGSASAGAAITVEDHCADLIRICNEAGVEQAIFVGCSIGGYILFEFWRRHRERVQALVLCNTKAQADDSEAQANRHRIADQVMQQGTGSFLDSMVPKLLGATTLRSRPDKVAEARAMMDTMTAAGLAAVQRGMAARADSVETLREMRVPTLLITGDEDVLTGIPEAQSMFRHLSGSQLTVLDRSGHYAPFEQPKAFADEMRRFLSECAR